MLNFVKAGILASALSCFLSTPLVVAAPSHLLDDVFLNSSHPFAESDFASTGIEARADKVPLRILPLGASIMSGTGSSTGNGCRKYLRDALRLLGWDVDMVGTRVSGTMIDHEHEAVSGDILTQVLARIPNIVRYKPNLVIINAGTNDIIRNIDIPNAGARLNAILNALWAGDGMANTCIMVSTLIPTSSDIGAANRGTVNSQYASLVSTRAAEGKCVYLADMDPGGQVWFSFDTDYMSGEDMHVHPNDVGHRKMAAVFYQAINKAISDNRIVAAGDIVVGSGVCAKFEGTGIDAGGLTQRGSGVDDGIYYHSSIGEGVLWTFDSDWDRGQFRFARLFNQNYDDLVAWLGKTSTTQVFVTWINSADGKGTFTNIQDMIPDLNCPSPAGVHFIDMNSDGLDDLVYIDPNGNAFLSINQGDGNRAAGKPPTFKRVSDSALIKNAEGYPRERVVLADIDGDGRGDYGVVNDAGDVFFWRNGWIDDLPKYWQALGKRFTGKGYGDVKGTRFEDVNGDGRDDYIWLDDVGEGHIWTNARSCALGAVGDGLNVAWREGFYTGESSGPAYKGMAGFVTKNETFLRDRVHFARIYGASSVFGNLPKQDYVFLQHTALDNGKHRFQMNIWKNVGGGATKLLADGDKYCNMMGHQNGMVDYVWTYSTGQMLIYANRGKGMISDSDADGYWQGLGTIWTPPSNMNRRDLHLQDWDGDGDCDIIYVNPDTGGVQVWLNNYPSTGTWSWTHLANPAPSLSCSQKRGLGIFDLAVRFADLTGNNRADYLCIEPDGRVSGFVHNSDDSWEKINQIKFAEDHDRANLRWADVNGDGLDDLLWVDKFTGDAWVSYNLGRGDPAQLSGSSFWWDKQTETAYHGCAAGGCEYWADINGDGYADEHYIEGTFTNKARTSLNPGCGLNDKTGDDSTMDGSLPTLPGSNTGGGGGGGGGDPFDLGNFLGFEVGGPADKARGHCDDYDNKVSETALFRCYRCDNEQDQQIVGALEEPYWEWNHSYAQSSVYLFESWFAIYNSSGFLGQNSWSLKMAYYYGTTVKLECNVGSQGNDNCYSDFGCDGDSYSLATYLVLTSYVRIFRFYQSWWEALDWVLSDWGSLSDRFSDTFVHKETTDIYLALDKWLMESVLGAVGGKLWSEGSTKLDLPEDSEAAEHAKEVYDAAYSAASDKLISLMGLDQEEDEPADMSDLAKKIVQKQKDTVKAYHDWLVSGDLNAVRDWAEQQWDGIWLLRNNETTDGIRQTAMKMTLAKLIPYAWNYRHDIYPYIIVSDDGGDTSNPAYPLKNSDVKSVRTNYDGKTFWIVGFSECPPSGPITGGCSWEHVMLPGIDELEGSIDEWGNLTWVEMVKSSWDGFKLNGNKNGYDIVTQGDSKTLDASGAKSPYDFVNGVLSPGYVTLPMCSSDLVISNEDAVDRFLKAEKCAYFPCCECAYWEEQGFDHIAGC